MSLNLDAIYVRMAEIRAEEDMQSLIGKPAMDEIEQIYMARKLAQHRESEAYARDYARRFQRNGDRGPSVLRAVLYSFGGALVAFGIIVECLK